MLGQGSSDDGDGAQHQTLSFKTRLRRRIRRSKNPAGGLHVLSSAAAPAPLPCSSAAAAAAASSSVPPCSSPGSSSALTSIGDDAAGDGFGAGGDAMDMDAAEGTLSDLSELDGYDE